MNYNSIINSKLHNDLDYYNIYSTVKPQKSLLINKNIDNYFNEIINITDPPKTYKIANKNNSYFSTFYKDYLENNMLLIFVIFIIIIFLTIRYYTKDIENEYFKNNINSKKYKKKIDLEKNNLKKYKKKLDLEKDKILSIIDELSNINYELDSKKYINNSPSNSKKYSSLEQGNPDILINSNKTTHNKENINFKLDNLQHNNNEKSFDFNKIKNNLIKNVSTKINNINNFDSNDLIKDSLYDNLIESNGTNKHMVQNIVKNIDGNMYLSNSSDTSVNELPSSKIYVDINKKLNDNDLVDGMYIEPPYI